MNRLSEPLPTRDAGLKPNEPDTAGSDEAGKFPCRGKTMLRKKTSETEARHFRCKMGHDAPTDKRPVGAPLRIWCSLLFLAVAATACGREQQTTESTLDALRSAAEQGDTDAQYSLGVMYDNGTDVPEDKTEAVRWYRMAAEQGHADAQYFLGARYARGEGVLEDDAEAVRWYRMAAEQGHADAQYFLGARYARGEGVLEDDAEAVLWYRLAAEGGHAEAQYFLGNIYDPDCQSGVADGVDVWLYCTGLVEVGLDDIVLAHMWYNIAGANGHDQARRRRDSLEGEMTRAEINLASELARACMASDYEDCDR